VGGKAYAVTRPSISAIYRSQASKSAFPPWERTFPGRKDSFIHGNARSWAALFPILDLLVEMWTILLLKFSNEPVNLNLVKITAWRYTGCPAAKLKGTHRFLQGPGSFTILTTFKLHSPSLSDNEWLGPIYIVLLGIVFLPILTTCYVMFNVRSKTDRMPPYTTRN